MKNKYTPEIHAVIDIVFHLIEDPDALPTELVGYVREAVDAYRLPLLQRNSELVDIADSMADRLTNAIGETEETERYRQWKIDNPKGG